MNKPVLEIDADAIRRVQMPEGCQVIYLRNKDPFQPNARFSTHGGSTVALMCFPSTYGFDFTHFVAGVALCHEDDRFVKAYGRGIAVTRLAATPVAVDLEIPISSLHMTPAGTLQLPKGRFLIEAVAKEIVERFSDVMLSETGDFGNPLVVDKERIQQLVNDRLDAYEAGEITEDQVYQGIPESAVEEIESEVQALEEWDDKVNKTFAPK